MQWNKRA